MINFDALVHGDWANVDPVQSWVHGAINDPKNAEYFSGFTKPLGDLAPHKTADNAGAFDFLTSFWNSLGQQQKAATNKSLTDAEIKQIATAWPTLNPQSQASFMQALSLSDQSRLQTALTPVSASGVPGGLNPATATAGATGTAATQQRDQFIAAIASQESGGNYAATNPSGALGKYQILASNVPGWSKEYLGFSITPAQFLASPTYQEQIAQGVLGSYYDKYGPRGAAAKWYSGQEGLANDYGPQKGGPSVGAYVDSVLGKMGIAGSGQPGDPMAAAASTVGTYTTPDGHAITQGSSEDAYYQMADSLWTQTYGQHAPYSVVSAIQASGVKTRDQLAAVLAEMPSDIPGVSIGVRTSVASNTQKLADKYLGRPVPDSLVKDLIKQGITTPGQIQLWWDSHPAKDMPKEDYQAIFDQANGWLSQPHSYNEAPHPSQIAAIYDKAQVQQSAIQAVLPNTGNTNNPLPDSPPARIGGAFE